MDHHIEDGTSVLAGLPVNGIGEGDGNHVDAVVPKQGPEQYMDAFPPLEHGTTAPTVGAAVTSPQTLPWTTHVQKSNKMHTASAAIITQIFTIPLEERKFRDESHFGGMDDQSKEIGVIMRENPDVTIEVASSRDKSLTIVISGRLNNVLKAKAATLAKLQTQSSGQVRIPREHHRNILGKGGARLKEIESGSSVKIQIPRHEDNSDVVKIIGPKEGIEKARHELQVISDELSKLAFERVVVPKVYHPFIRGPFDKTLTELREKTGARINIPPYTVQKDEITVAGEKEGVQTAVRLIKQIYEDKDRTSGIVSVEVTKSQHKYIIGPKGAGLSEILQSTGVSVEVPSAESASDSIVLRGDATKLGIALTEVYSKANSQQQLSVVAASWLHRFIIGKGGQNLSQITQGKPRIHISFNEGEDRILVEGPSDEVAEVQYALKNIVEDLLKRMTMVEVHIDPRYHKHLIGKAGVNIKRIKEDTGCSIRIPGEDGNSDVIRIEGEPSGVEQARLEVLALADKLDNEKTKDLIIEQRFHRIMIGQHGAKINEVKDKFPEVQIKFPESNTKCDIVTLRGPREQVTGADKLLVKMYKDMLESNYEMEVKIFKQFHKNVIGKNGSTIKKIKEETDTRIQLPVENSDSDVIKIIGKRKSVETAAAKIEAIQRELANVAEIEINIPHKLHTAVIGPKGIFIQQVQDESGGCQIRFPSSEKQSDVVRIRGPKSDVEKARKLLEELVLEKKEASFEDTIKAKPEFHKFLIGRRGANIEQLRKKTKARVVFPDRDDKDKETVTIIGKKEAVADAKKLLLEKVKALENIVEEEVTVDSKWHRHFLQRRGEILNQLSEEYGGVLVSFPKSGSKEDKVRIKGPSECVNDAKKRIAEIVDELVNEVTIELVIPQKHHRALIGRNGQHVQQISTDFNVGIKFPTRAGAANEPPSPPATTPAESTNGHSLANGDAASDTGSSDTGSVPPGDVVRITGRTERCEDAKDALMALVPITETMEVPVEYHRLVIGAKGANIRQFNDKFEVQIKVPSEETESNVLDITGTPVKIAAAKEELQNQMKKWDEEKADREARNYQAVAEVPFEYHRQIIGPRGAGIQKIKNKYGNNVQRIDIPNPDKQSNSITVTGYQAQADACAAELQEMARVLASYVTAELFIHSAVHPRLIGKGGRNLSRLCEQLGVQINMPGRDSTGEDANLIKVHGAPDKVDDACDHIVNMATEWLDEMRERGELDENNLNGNGRGDEEEETNKRPKKGGNKGGAQKKHPNPKMPGFEVVGAPWDAANNEDFPTIGGRPAAEVSTNTSFAWGSRQN